jgi:HD-GYP domain-containing protein (c-di-GMP phosphodiesterase class II)
VVEEELVAAQAIRYAEEFRELYSSEQRQRVLAEAAHADLQVSYRATVASLATALELRDYGTGGHAERVTAVALRLTQATMLPLIEDEELEYGFLLHDVGKIGVADSILLKPGPLNEVERAQIKQHPLLGERIIAGIPFLQGVAREIVVSHHERWDGTGYPSGLSGAEIPVAARIFAFADTFDAMTNQRPYRPPLSVDEAIERIAAGAGTQFDPELAPIFISVASGRQTAA